jgi:hypothetical protein
MGFFVRLKYVKCPVYAGKRHAVSTISITSGSSETVIRGRGRADGSGRYDD